MDAVVLVIFGACPSHIILSSSAYICYYFLIPCDYPPKISGLLELKFCKFLLTSTPLLPPDIKLFVFVFCVLLELPVPLKQVFKCFVIYEDNIFFLHT